MGEGWRIDNHHLKKAAFFFHLRHDFKSVADYAFVKAYQGDSSGNLVYRATSRNFNPMMATAATVTIAEVEEIVDAGVLDPESIVTPGIYVDQLVRGEVYEKRIEKRTYRDASGSGTS